MSNQIIEIYLPEMGHSVKEVQISKWCVSVGDTIKKDDIFIEVSTDKIENEVPSPYTGIVKEIVGNEGDRVLITNPIMRLEITN